MSGVTGSIASRIATGRDQLRGLLAQIASAKNDALLFERYERLSRRLDRLTEHRILRWTHEAATTLAQLGRARVRVGTMDLRIASIALANDATLLSRNLRDFQKVPNLRVENWLDG